MDVSSYVLLSHEQALSRQLDIVANNMANTSTAGYKRERPVFHEYVEQGRDAVVPSAKNTSYVLDFGAVHDTTAGTFQATGNTLDVMIDGAGYLSVEAGDGTTAYTRGGALKILESGDLATANGQRVLGDTGAAINIPPDQAGSVGIAADGTLTTAQGPVGRIGVTVFASESGVAQRGDGLMSATNGRTLTAAETKLKAGGIESSNVQPIVETAAMVEILRSYQTNQRMSDSLNDMRMRAIDKLARVN